jgi:hypothetical protein
LKIPQKGYRIGLAVIPYEEAFMIHFKTRALALLVFAASLAAITGSAKGW